MDGRGIGDAIAGAFLTAIIGAFIGGAITIVAISKGCDYARRHVEVHVK